MGLDLFNVERRENLRKALAGQRSCKSCGDTFDSQRALDNHLRNSAHQLPGNEVMGGPETFNRHGGMLVPVEDNTDEMNEALADLIDDLNTILSEDALNQPCPPKVAAAAQATVDYIRARIDANPDAEAAIVKAYEDDHSLVRALGLEDADEETQAVVAGAFLDIAVRAINKADGSTGIRWGGAVGKELR